MHRHPNTVKYNTHSYETHQHQCNSHECQCKSHECQCNSHECQCNSHQCHCNKQQDQYNFNNNQYNLKNNQYSGKHCQCSICQEHHRKHCQCSMCQQHHRKQNIQDPHVQSRFRFHDMAHGNTLSEFPPPDNTWNMMPRTPMPVIPINQDMVSTDHCERYGNRQLVSSKTPMQHQMYWYGY
jgi:hypothetical protein